LQGDRVTFLDQLLLTGIKQRFRDYAYYAGSIALCYGGAAVIKTEPISQKDWLLYLAVVGAGGVLLLGIAMWVKIGWMARG